MRTTTTCPKCSGKKIVVASFQNVDSRGDTASASLAAIPAVGVTVPTFLGLLKNIKVVGRFESWICAACGYTEFYAHELGDVDALAAQHPDDVRIVDGTIPSKGPFR